MYIHILGQISAYLDSEVQQVFSVPHIDQHKAPLLENNWMNTSLNSAVVLQTFEFSKEFPLFWIQM